MPTHFLGREEVEAYLRDLAARLGKLGPERPLAWCVIGLSGATLAKELLNLEPSLQTGTKVIPVDYDRDSGNVRVRASRRDLRDQNVLVLDSSVHSGSTMLATVEAVQRFAPKTTASYTLILKLSSSFVPTYWAVTIDDHDRAYFLLKQVPNNRLDPKIPRDHGHLRQLRKADVGLPPLVCGVTSMDRVTWGDRWWDMRSSQKRRTYLLEIGKTIVGYITYSVSSESMTIDEVAVAEDQQNRKYGGTLMRWAETMARQMRCTEIALWAIEAGVEFYKRENYRLVPSDEDMEIDGDRFKLMKKRILYHLRPPLH